MSGETLLRARGASVGYRGDAVVRDVDLELRAGEVHGLIGPNGAGKSTLLRALAGLVPLRSGRVTVMVPDVGRGPDARRIGAARGVGAADEAGAIGERGATREPGASGASRAIRATREPGASGASRAIRATREPGASGASRAIRATREPDASLRLGANREIDLARLRRAGGLATSPYCRRSPISPPATARTVVGLGRYAHRTRLARMRGDLDAGDLAIVDAALERVGASHLAEAPITELSGGQRQLVLLAKQLAQESRVLLLDEPVSALDLGYQLEVLELLRELAAEGRGVFVVLHDLGLAARSCDRLTVLERGVVRASGAPAEVLRPELLDGLYGIVSRVDHDPHTDSPRITALRRRRIDPLARSEEAARSGSSERQPEPVAAVVGRRHEGTA